MTILAIFLAAVAGVWFATFSRPRPSPDVEDRAFRALLAMEDRDAKRRTLRARQELEVEECVRPYGDRYAWTDAEIALLRRVHRAEAEHIAYMEMTP